jgi:hypothetical protein
MKAEQIFSIVNLIAMISWILLAVAPRWVFTKKADKEKWQNIF